MKYTLVVLLLALMALTSAFARDAEGQCRPGEYYDSCGLPCEETCLDPIPEDCSYECAQGCYCEEGTIREHIGGDCIPSTSC
uniref:TIL domain-containing protein n=1 Tax=Anopheles stephensi TaxID=30069 RepID=A0A182Y2M0_ANOST